jgi:hypothetical protein
VNTSSLDWSIFGHRDALMCLYSGVSDSKKLKSWWQQIYITKDGVDLCTCPLICWVLNMCSVLRISFESPCAQSLAVKWWKGSQELNTHVNSYSKCYWERATEDQAVALGKYKPQRESVIEAAQGFQDTGDRAVSWTGQVFHHKGWEPFLHRENCLSNWHSKELGGPELVGMREWGFP